eukprot:Opistho-2@91161
MPPTKTQDHIHDLVTLMKKTREDELLVEVLGILGNMNIAQFDFRKLLTDYDLVPFINERLLPGAADDDVVLEVCLPLCVEQSILITCVFETRVKSGRVYMCVQCRLFCLTIPLRSVRCLFFKCFCAHSVPFVSIAIDVCVLWGISF